MTPDQMVAQPEDAPEETLTTIGEDPECEAAPEDLERAEDLVNRATEAIAAGQNSRALSQCREATEAAPSMTGAWVLLGMVAREAGENKEALEAYRRVGELDPGRPDLFETLAELEKIVAEEEEEAEAAEARGPGFVQRYSPVMLATAVGLLVLALGIVLIVRHGRVASEGQFRQIMEQGYQAMGVQQFDQAEQQFTEALRLRPNDPDALVWLQNARDGRKKAEEYAQWQYETAGGKYPGATEDLAPGEILPTDERKAAEAVAAAGGPGYGTPGATYPGSGDSGHPYSWKGSGGQPSAPAGTGGFPAPTSEGPEYTGPGTATPAPQPQPQPQPVAPQPQPTPQLTPSGAGGGATEAPKGYLRITVGQPKPVKGGGGEVTGPSADSVRAQADALRRAGRGSDARKLYLQAIDLYDREAQSDPQLRAVKQSGADTCRRALEQSK